MKYKGLYIAKVKELQGYISQYRTAKKDLDRKIQAYANEYLGAKQNLDKIVARMSITIDNLLNDKPAQTKHYGGAERKDYSHQHNGYTHEDILKMVRQGKTTDEICNRLGAKRGEVNAVRAHNGMGTYNKRKRERELTKQEEKSLKKDLKFMSTRDAAKLYDITVARAAAHKAKLYK